MLKVQLSSFSPKQINQLPQVLRAKGMSEPGFAPSTSRLKASHVSTMVPAFYPPYPSNSSHSLNAESRVRPEGVEQLWGGWDSGHGSGQGFPARAQSWQGVQLLQTGHKCPSLPSPVCQFPSSNDPQHSLIGRLSSARIHQPALAAPFSEVKG